MSATDQMQHPVFGVRNAQAVLPGRDRIALSGPDAGRPACDDVPFTYGRTRWRRGERQIGHADLDRRVEDAQRLIVSDVLLAWLPSIYGNPRFGVSVMATQRVRGSSVG